MDDDDVPWADPQIRISYEAALGRFILAYNEVDFRLSLLIGRELEARGLSDDKDQAMQGPFSQRLVTMRILASSVRRLEKLPFELLTKLNSDRNNLAHGHFDQNPFDGSYQIAFKRKVKDYPIDKVIELTSKLHEIAEQLRHAEVIYDFADLGPEETS